MIAIGIYVSTLPQISTLPQMNRPIMVVSLYADGVVHKRRYAEASLDYTMIFCKLDRRPRAMFRWRHCVWAP